MILKLSSVVYLRVVTAKKQRQVDIDNVRENNARVTHDYAGGDLLYVEISGIYLKLDYKRQGLYIITEIFTNATV